MKRRTGKRIWIVMGVIAMLFNLFGCKAGPGKGGEKMETGGTCGENMSWKYDKRTQTLTISGSGEMVTTDRFMWSDYAIKKLEISEGVTSIDKEAFYSNHKLQGQLKLPSTLKSIGDFAFYGCDGLKGPLELPDSVETFGSNAFYNCGAGLLVEKNSDREAFVKANGYTFAYDADDGFRYQYRKVSNVDTLYLTGYKGAGGNVTIPAGPVVIGESAFADNTAVTRVTIPNTVTTLD